MLSQPALAFSRICFGESMIRSSSDASFSGACREACKHKQRRPGVRRECGDTRLPSISPLRSMPGASTTTLY